MEYPVCNWNRVVSKSQGRVLEKEVTKEYFSKKKSQEEDTHNTQLGVSELCAEHNCGRNGPQSY
jgi:hypothetical protein